LISRASSSFSFNNGSYERGLFMGRCPGSTVSE
jgi:hypothetical protein